MFFSVIIPCYNAADTIVRCLDSIINQTFQDFEIVIVDDGSNDNTQQVVTDYFSEHKGIIYQYVVQDNGGPAKARNIAVSRASGEYLAFLDADDGWAEKKLAVMYEIIHESNMKFLSSRYAYTLQEEVKKIEVKKYTFNDFLISNRTSTPCTVIQRKLFNQVGGFDERLRYSEDYNLWLKVSFLEPLNLIDVPFVILYKRAYGVGGLSSHLWKMQQGELHNFKILYDEGYINLLQFILVCLLSTIKYLKRLIYTALR